MNILELDINENCSENMKILFFIKDIVNQKLNMVEENSCMEYATKLLESFDNDYKIQHMALLAELLNIVGRNSKEKVIEEINELNHDKILRLSSRNIFTSQTLKKFKVLDELSLDKELSKLIEFLSNKDIDFNKFVEDKKKAISNIDDTMYETILNEEYEKYDKNDFRGNCCKLIHIYSNDFIALVDIIRKEYIMKFVDKKTINIIRKLNKEKQIPAFNCIYELLVANDKIIPDNIIEMMPVLATTKNETAYLYLFAEKEGLSNPRAISKLAKFYMTDAICRNYDKAIDLYKKAAEGGITQSYIEIAKYYASRNNLKSALEYYEKAKETGHNVDEDIQKLKDIMYKEETSDERLKPLHEIIDKYKSITKKDCYKITLVENSIPEILDSKIGGNPYIPEGDDVPRDSNGDYMPLLIQINFADIESEIYPKTGILEIFMDKSLNYPSQYVVRCYKEISDNYMTEFPKIDLSEFVYNGTSKIKLEKSIAYMPSSDFRSKEIIKRIVGEIITNEELVKNLKEVAEVDYEKCNFESYPKDNKSLICNLVGAALYDYIDNASIMLGGYGDFTQDDPRQNSMNQNNTECLVKIDSVGNEKFCIGDAGIISVLISEEDLRNENFENAELYWDCC